MAAQVYKSGVVHDGGFSEYHLNCKYDSQIYVESDGSLWLHVFHHNNPGSGLFTSSCDWSNGCYIDSNRWFNMNVCKLLSGWEFIYAQTTTAGGTLTKYRWIQNVSPYGTTYSDVAPSAVSRITTSGYTDGGYGGLYVLNSNAYMVIANNSSGNWYGATGSWTTWSSGMPGYPNTAISTGCADIYARIDGNLSSTTGTAQFGKIQSEYSEIREI